jgi:tetratricopeptide (TPR) repeat protein
VNDAAAPEEVCLLSTDVDADGTKFILTAGVPTSREFDGERMLRALRRIVEQDLPLPVKIGVHHGPVFAGVVGPWFRLTYTIIGDAVNTAARVMGHAKPGEILATAEVLNRSQALFEAEPVAPFAVKGKKLPLTAYRIGERTGDRLRRPRARFRLAGRREELAAVLEEADAASTGGGRVVQLVGPAGIGKSRLVDEVHERRPDTALVLAGCNQYESATPYHVVGALVRSLLDLGTTPTAAELADALAGAAPHLVDRLPLFGDVVGVEVPDNDSTASLTASHRTERAADAVGRLLEVRLAGAAAIVIEDLHWVDPESWSVLRRLVRTALPRSPWLLVLTSRHRLVLDVGGTGEDDGRIVELAPLSDDVGRELVFAAVEEGLVSIDRGQLLLEKAGGNPFFLQELLRSGSDGGGDLPEDVDALIQAQLDQLPVRDREVLGYAAVLGADVDVDLLARTAGIDEAEQRATFRRLSSFVEPAPGGAFRFRHALVHDGAYGRLPYKRRRELHRAAAAVLEADCDGPRRPDLLAVHTFHARDWARARQYSLEAATAAAARYANLTAAGHYRRALEAGRYAGGTSDVEVASTWERLGDVLLLASSYEEAVDAYRRARRLAPPERQLHLCGQIGQLRERQGRFDEALRWYNRAIGLDDGNGELARLLVEAGIVKIRQGKPKEALALGAHAATLATDVRSRARSSYVSAWAGLLLGEEAADEQRRMVELFESSDDPIGLSLAHQLVAMAAYYRGDWDDAAVAYQEAGALRRRVGDEVAAAASAGNLGELLSDQGHFDRARGLLEECRTVCAATGFRSSRYFAEMTLGRLEARVGAFDAGEALLRSALGALESMRMAGHVYDAQRYLGELALFRGDLDAAMAWAEVVERSATLGFPAARLVGLRLRVCAQLEAGDVARAAAEASELLGRLDPAARDYDTALSLVAVACGLEAAGDPGAAAARGRADAALRRLGVVVAGELLVFGPASARVAAPALAAVAHP